MKTLILLFIKEKKLERLRSSGFEHGVVKPLSPAIHMVVFYTPDEDTATVSMDCVKDNCGLQVQIESSDFGVFRGYRKYYAIIWHWDEGIGIKVEWNQNVIEVNELKKPKDGYFILGTEREETNCWWYKLNGEPDIMVTSSRLTKLSSFVDEIIPSKGAEIVKIWEERIFDPKIAKGSNRTEMTESSESAEADEGKRKDVKWRMEDSIIVWICPEYRCLPDNMCETVASKGYMEADDLYLVKPGEEKVENNKNIVKLKEEGSVEISAAKAKKDIVIFGHGWLSEEKRRIVLESNQLHYVDYSSSYSTLYDKMKEEMKECKTEKDVHILANRWIRKFLGARVPIVRIVKHRVINLLDPLNIDLQEIVTLWDEGRLSEADEIINKMRVAWESGKASSPLSKLARAWYMLAGEYIDWNDPKTPIHRPRDMDLPVIRKGGVEKAVCLFDGLMEVSPRNHYEVKDELMKVTSYLQLVDIEKQGIGAFCKFDKDASDGRRIYYFLRMLEKELRSPKDISPSNNVVGFFRNGGKLVDEIKRYIDWFFELNTLFEDLNNASRDTSEVQQREG